MDTKSVILLGFPISARTTAETLDRILELTGSTPASGCRVLATVNVDFVVNALSMFRAAPRHRELAEILQSSPLVTADGMPLIVLSRLLGDPLPERVAGADLVPLLAERCARTGKSLYFLGGSAESAAAAAKILEDRYPGLRIAGIDTPFVKLDGSAESQEQDRRICMAINAAAPDILLIGFGNPKQELWAARNAWRLRVPVAIGIGGTFNFICGRVKRAPVWMQRAGLEWIFRVFQEPGRLWKRYGWGLLKFGMLVLQCTAGNLLGRWGGRGDFTGRPVEFADTVTLDCAGLTRVDNRVRQLILETVLRGRDLGKPLELSNLGWRARWQLKAHRIYPFPK